MPYADAISRPGNVPQSPLGMLSGNVSELTLTRAKVLELADICRLQARLEGLPAAEQWLQSIDSAWARCHCFLALDSLRFGERAECGR